MWNCVDFERGVILVNKQLNKSQRKGGQYEFTAPKNGKSRYITPAPYVMDLLKEQKEIQEKQKEAAGVAWEESGLVFTNALGRYVSYRALYDDFKKVVTRLGFPSARIHNLRHPYVKPTTKITLFRKNGKRVIFSIYSHMDNSSLILCNCDVKHFSVYSKLITILVIGCMIKISNNK